MESFGITKSRHSNSSITMTVDRNVRPFSFWGILKLGIRMRERERAKERATFKCVFVQTSSCQEETKGVRIGENQCNLTQTLKHVVVRLEFCLISRHCHQIISRWCGIVSQYWWMCQKTFRLLQATFFFFFSSLLRVPWFQTNLFYTGKYHSRIQGKNLKIIILHLITMPEILSCICAMLK